MEAQGGFTYWDLRSGGGWVIVWLLLKLKECVLSQ